MNAVMKDTPISYGLALEVLRGRRMKAVGHARQKLRELRTAGATAAEVELAEAALQDARDAVAKSQRMSDEEARAVLEDEGEWPCRS